MSDVYGWLFHSEVDLDQARARLDGAAGFTFAIREAEHEGRYVNGTDARGIRLRVLGEVRVGELELYFPSAARGEPLSAEARAEVVDVVIPDLLTRLGARDVRAD